MSIERDGRVSPTPREYLKDGGVVGGGVLAGCTGQTDSETTTPTTTSETTRTSSEDETATESESSPVSIEPVSEVTESAIVGGGF